MSKSPAKKDGRLHRATFAKDKRMGGYLIRVAGPQSNRFAGRTVPVTLKDGGEQDEILTELVWSGKDQESGENVTLYKFQKKERSEIDDEIAF